MISKQIYEDRKTGILFMIESCSFIMSGFLVALGFKFGWLLLLFAFFMAYITGKSIQKDTIKKYKEEND